MKKYSITFIASSIWRKIINRAVDKVEASSNQTLDVRLEVERLKAETNESIADMVVRATRMATRRNTMQRELTEAERRLALLEARMRDSVRLLGGPEACVENQECKRLMIRIRGEQRLLEERRAVMVQIENHCAAMAKRIQDMELNREHINMESDLIQHRLDVQDSITSQEGVGGDLDMVQRLRDIRNRVNLREDYVQAKVEVSNLVDPTPVTVDAELTVSDFAAFAEK